MDERNGGVESQHVRADEAQLGRRPQEGRLDNMLLLQRRPLGLGLYVTVESLLKEDLN